MTISIRKLQELNKDSLDGTLSICHHIKSICDPLYSMGFNSFGHSIIYQNKSFLNFYTFKDYFGHINNTGLLYEDTPFVNFLHHARGIDYLPGSCLSTKVLAVARDAYDFALVGVIVKKSEESHRVYFLGAPKERRNSMEMMFLNERHKFEEFISYYDSKIYDLEENRKEQKWMLLPSSSEIALDNHPKRTTTAFLIDDKNIKLTQRQIECLSLLSQGKSIKVIAQDLNISPHTVSKYFATIKMNTGYHFKTDLLTLYSKIRNKI